MSLVQLQTNIKIDSKNEEEKKRIPCAHEMAIDLNLVQSSVLSQFSRSRKNSTESEFIIEIVFLRDESWCSENK